MHPSKLLPAVFFFCVFLLPATANARPGALSENDLMDCAVLTGKKKQAELQSFIARLKDASTKGDVSRGLDLAGILHNRFACLEEEILGDQPWTVSVQSGSTSDSQTTYRPTLKNLNQYPAALAALRDAIAAYERIADRNLVARTAVGRYIAEYNDSLERTEEGYFYFASAYEAECNDAKVARGTRCRMLKQDKMLYLSLLNGERRARIDAKAREWAIAYSTRSAQ